MKKQIPFITLVSIGLIEVFYGILWGKMRIYAHEAPFSHEMNYTKWTDSQAVAYRKYIDIFKDQWSIVAWFGLLTIVAAIIWFLIDRRIEAKAKAQPPSAGDAENSAPEKYRQAGKDIKTYTHERIENQQSLHVD
ncbi:MAG: hypothetical protein PHR77_06070 [Kiritimatiellae bacterium]|nr:hypothetical protein [Kiritimatiellia bacterium]MDD5520501.1 hypothetical protein [Kiritimatiellia bacterium]